MRSELALLLCCALAACPIEPPDEVDAGADVLDAGPEQLQFLPLIDDVADLELVRGANGAVKYLAQVDGAPVTAPILSTCAFQNTGLYDFHLLFLLAQPGGEELTFDEYLARVIRRARRVWWGGEIVFLAATAHPISGEPGTLAWAIYTEDSANNRLTLDDVRAGHARLAPCLPAFDGKLAFAPSSNEQIQTVRALQGALAKEGIAVLLP